MFFHFFFLSYRFIRLCFYKKNAVPISKNGLNNYICQKKKTHYNKMYNMKKLFLSLAVSALFLGASEAVKAEVTLPKIISSGMVVQRNDTARIWGKADAGEQVTVTFLKKRYNTIADEKGNWIVSIPTKKHGGPYSMQINSITLDDIYVGDVWLGSGQSNMDVHIDRVSEIYADEVMTDANPKIHLIQFDRNITPEAYYPQTEVNAHQYGWESLSPEKVGHWSAIGYFFCKDMYEKTGVPQGFINASMGGSNIVAWLSREKMQELAPRYVDQLDYIKLRQQYLGKPGEETDPGMKENWMAFDYDDSDWEVVDQYDKNIGDIYNQKFVGHLWFRKEFYVPDSLVNRQALLRLGLLIESDETYVNGTFVGSTGYQYPPRKYKVMPGVLKPGRNVLTIRLKTNGDPVKFQGGKPYKLIFPSRPESPALPLTDPWIELEGQYKMKRGDMTGGRPAFDNQNASVLYNLDINPIRNYRIAGAIWNQGESNADARKATEYGVLLKGLAEDWRSSFGNIPLIVVQLANYMQRHEDANYHSGWTAIRNEQRKAAEEVIPNCALATTIDVGEWHDIHPWRKKDVAQRCALQMRRLYLGDKTPNFAGPLYKSVEFEGGKAIISFKEGTDNLAPEPEGGLKGFKIAGADGKFHWADAHIDGNKVVVSCPEVKEPKIVRYAWDDDPEISLFGITGLPATPFTTEQ